MNEVLFDGGFTHFVSTKLGGLSEHTRQRS
jgi:hypothetical protein